MQVFITAGKGHLSQAHIDSIIDRYMHFAEQSGCQVALSWFLHICGLLLVVPGDTPWLLAAASLCNLTDVIDVQNAACLEGWQL